MGSNYLDILLLLAGLLVVGYSQQYEVEPSRTWQPSRTQRTQNPSLFGNSQSSPKRVAQSVTRTQVPEIQFEQPRLRQQSSRTRTPSRAPQNGPSYATPQVFTTAPLTTQYRSRESAEVNNQRPSSFYSSSSLEENVDDGHFRKNQQIDVIRNNRVRSRNNFRKPTTTTTTSTTTTTTTESSRTTESARNFPRRRDESRPKFERRPKPQFPTASEELSNIQVAPTVVPFKSSNEQISLEKESAERHGSRKFQRPTASSRSVENDSRSLERTSPQRFSPRTGPTSVESTRKQFRPDPLKISSREQSESTGRFASREETSLPVQTTEGYTELPNKQARGRARASTEKPTSLGQRPLSRGDKKANLSTALKHNDEVISEEDNYPKEFIEKIKNSAEIKPSFAPKTNSRLGRARTFQQSKPVRQSTTDSDVSESIHEEVFEQELSFVAKPKESPVFSKGRYFGRPKSSITTTTTTSTTTTTRPQVSNVDVLRQKYLDKLKQSQEERQQKLSNLRPKLQVTGRPDVEKRSTTIRSFTKEPFRPSSRYSRTQKPKSAASEPQNTVRFRPRFSLTSREPDSSIEPATPTVAEHARTRNRYARLRKEELSVETPEVKTSWSKEEDKPKPIDAAYNFIRLRTKDLTPLASEDVMESIINNELAETQTTFSSSSSTTEPATTTTRVEEITDLPMTTVVHSNPITTTVASSETMDSSMNEMTTVPTTIKETTTTRDQVTIAPVQVVTEAEEKVETIMPSLASASTRHRFSSKYSTEPTQQTSVTEITTENDAPASTISFSTSSLSPSSTSTVTTTISTTTQSTTTKKQIKTTTQVPSFLKNRPILRNLVSLFAPSTTTTTKKPTTRKPKTKKSKPKTKTTTTTTTTTISPLPLAAASAEEIINSTQEVINNHTLIGNSFGKAPRDELDALTPLTFINTTEASTTASNYLADRAGFPNTTEEMKNVTSQSVFFDYSSSTTETLTTSTTSTTTPSTTTAADYFVYGIYPNNTVVRKRAWKTFDYEKYMSPYVIFGIYPNNTIVRKFPNGTIINDEFMTSDNEIAGPSTSLSTASTTTSTTTTTPTMSSTAEDMEPTTEAVTEADTEAPEEEDEDEEVEAENEMTETSIEQTSTESMSDSSTEAQTDTSTEAQSEKSTDSITSTEAQSDTSTEAQPEKSTNADSEETTTDMSSESTTKKSVFENIWDLLDRSPATTENPSDDFQTIPPIYWRMGAFLTGETATSTTMRTETTTTSTIKNNEETTVDPSLNQVLPLSLEEVQSLWSGNFSDSAKNETDSEVSSSISLDESINLLSGRPDKETVSLSNIAFRALSTSAATTTVVTTTMRPLESTTDAMTSTAEPTTRKPRVKFVTLTPSIMVTSDIQADDAITQSSEHVQRVTKASTQIPNDLLTSVFGQLEEKASSPIPDILGTEVEGDGLTAALARRIIALAMERAKSTTTDIPSTTTTEMTTTNIPTTISAAKTTKKAKSTRTTSKGPSSSLNSISGGKELDAVLQQLLLAQNLEQLDLATTVKAPADLEKAVENQIRLAEEVRKASRTMMKKKKKKSRTTTTPAPPPFLGFLFNIFNRPSSNPTPIPTAGRTAKKVQSPSPSPNPDSQVFVLTSLPTDVDATSSTDSEVQGERQTRGQLLTAAIDVTRAVSKFMGTVITNAAQSFQSFMRNNNWGR